jgi:MFS family permease
MRALLAKPYVGRYFAADTISSLGDYALWLAMGIWVKDLTGSISAASLVMFAYTAGVLFSPMSGAVADRFPRKPLLIWTYLATAAVLAALLTVHDRTEVPVVYAVMFLYGLSGSLTGPTQAALIPALVGRDLIGQANSLQQTLRVGLRLVAPALGTGALVAWGGAAVAAIDAATFVVAAAVLATIKIGDADAPAHGGADQARAGLRAELGAGFRYLLAEPLLRQLTLAVGTALLFTGFSTALGFTVATKVLHHAPSFVAVIVTMQGIGAVLGGLAAAQVLRRIGERGLVVAALVTAAAASLLRAVPQDAVVLAGNVVMGAAVPLLIVGAVTAVQLRTPSHLLGRVSGAGGLAMNLPQTVGQALGAGLVAVVPYVALCAVVAGSLLTAAGYLGVRGRAGSDSVPQGEPAPAAAAASAADGD